MPALAELVVLGYDFRRLEIFVRPDPRANSHLAVINGYVNGIAVCRVNASYVLSLLLPDRLDDVNVH